VTVISSDPDSVERQDPFPEPFDSRLAAARPALLAFARRIAPEDAEDLCHDTLARALRYRASFDQQRPLLPWLRVSLMRESVDQARRRAAQVRAFEHDGELQAPDPGPEMSNTRRVARLLAALESLDAQLLRGFHLEHRSIAELSQATGLAEGSVRSRLHRARQRLAAQPPDMDE
jgi:RNA polymerase sigma-70 factor, ECF subfamily